MFAEGEVYTRREIADQLGGSIQSYLPTKSGIVVCGCFKADVNENAPRIVSVGEGKIRVRSAQLCVAQKSQLPVFIKQSTNEWKFIGQWRAVSFVNQTPWSIGEIRYVGTLTFEFCG